MTKGEMLAYYKTMSAADQRNFDRWLKANMVIGSIVAVGLLAMALAGAGANSLGPSSAIADPRPAVASPARSVQTGSLSAYELMTRLAPGQLPVQQVDEPF
jgi:hypothetical protein